MLNTIKRIAALARIIIIDGLRRYALIGLVALSLATEIGGLLFFDFIHRDIGRASNDFIFSVSWVAGFIFLFFHAVHVMAWDEERRVIYTLLARPISRSEYVIGVFCGLGTLLFLLNLVLGLIGWGTLMMIKNSVGAEYFLYFSHGYYCLNWLGLFATELMVLAAIMLFSGLIRGGFPVLLVSIAFYMICSGLPVVRDLFANSTVQDNALSPVRNLLTGMTMIFPDFSRLDLKDAVISISNLPQVSLLMTNFGLFVAYTALMLWIGCIVYRRRDLQ